MKKTYGILVCNNLNNVFNLDRDLYEKMNKELSNFFILDLSFIYGSKLEKYPKSFKIFRPKSFNEVNNFLKYSLNIFINHIPRNFKYIKAHIFFNKKNFINIEINRGNSIQLAEQFYKKKNYLFNLKKIAIRGFYKFLGLIRLVKNYDYLFISQKNIKKYYWNKRDKLLNNIFSTKIFYKHQKIIEINDKAADLSFNKKQTKEYIVYVDTPLSKYGSSHIPGIDLPDKYERKKFYKLLSKKLLFLSKKYKRKVVICLHPKTNSKDVKVYFKNFICKKFNLWKYLNKAFLTTSIASTSLAYSIYNKKKILLFDSSHLGKFLRYRSQVLTINYKINTINLDDMKKITLNLNNINTVETKKILNINVQLSQKKRGVNKIIDTIKTL